ncbi:hypothetical protein FVW59_19145 [Parahaliea aestuarii]|uniref:Uncharacterized protein n=1 Tax=Parahaliea aestuarii TaxID=1852021 RepID=A0A5C8ZMG1_9GAMM|nr:hypothetical protein FVW59_19145 [Parahaliea aestuarii]
MAALLRSGWQPSNGMGGRLQRYTHAARARTLSARWNPVQRWTIFAIRWWQRSRAGARLWPNGLTKQPSDRRQNARSFRRGRTACCHRHTSGTARPPQSAQCGGIRPSNRGRRPVADGHGG